MSSPEVASSSTLLDYSAPPSSPLSAPSLLDDVRRPNTPTDEDVKLRRKNNRTLCNKSFTLSILAMLLITILATLYRELPSSQLTHLLHLPHNYQQHEQAAPFPTPLQPALPPSSRPRKHDPAAWLRKHRHSHTNLDSTSSSSSASVSSIPHHKNPNRPRAALISLVRNSELAGMLQSMRHLEHTFNRFHAYPWLFFSESSFSPDFISATSNATSGHTEYHIIPRKHWSVPEFVNQTLFHDSLSYLGGLGVGKGGLVSYRHMCRWNSGFFALEEALSGYEWYWRVEPDVHFFCGGLGYDVFRFMEENELVYGFNMNVLEDARSFPSLWPVTVEFLRKSPSGYLHEGAGWRWLVDDDEEEGEGEKGGGGTGGYNNCQFFSNFEIGSLDFFRSEAYQAYFKFLDEKGGFFYERFGDAPIHTLAVSLFAAREQVWFFGDIGYQHDALRYCPGEENEGSGGGGGRCMCEKTRMDENFYKLVPMESPQKKPRDTCLRRWLAGEWLQKREGWDREVEILLGGDGYGGYVKE